jgi:hypothetical protein
VLGGEKATLLWDGLPAHRSRLMRAWLATQHLASSFLRHAGLSVA